jgi:predicted DNA binding protein
MIVLPYRIFNRELFVPLTRQVERTICMDGLSPRQREAFQLARARGYYEYPRDVCAQELADEFGVSRTTFLEHLRKAEREQLTGIEFH